MAFAQEIGTCGRPTSTNATSKFERIERQKQLKHRKYINIIRFNTLTAQGKWGSRF